MCVFSFKNIPYFYVQIDEWKYVIKSELWPEVIKSEIWMDFIKYQDILRFE